MMEHLAFSNETVHDGLNLTLNVCYCGHADIEDQAFGKLYRRDGDKRPHEVFVTDDGRLGRSLRRSGMVLDVQDAVKSVAKEWGISRQQAHYEVINYIAKLRAYNNGDMGECYVSATYTDEEGNEWDSDDNSFVTLGYHWGVDTATGMRKKFEYDLDNDCIEKYILEQPISKAIEHAKDNKNWALLSNMKDQMGDIFWEYY